MPTSRSISSWVTVAIVGTFPVLAQNAGPAQPRIAQAVDDTRLVTLSGNTHPLARAEYDQGAAAPDLPMERMLLLLNRGPEQEAALERLLEEQQDPSSANFHHWLTPEQFGEQFGPATADIEKITDWLISSGFRVERVAAGRGVIEFSGNAAQVQRGFHTEIHRYSVNGEQHWANARDPRIPAALSPVVAGIVSLHDFPAKALHHRTGTLRRLSSDGPWVPVNAAPQFNYQTSDGTEILVAPYDFATIYNILPAWNAGIDGSGQSIAIAGRSNISLQDVRKFRSLFGLPANDPTIILNGPDPGTADVDSESENVLDTEWAGAVAKRATIKLVVSKSTTATDGSVLSAEYIVNNNVAPVLSMSYGECELGLMSSGNQLFKNLWQQAAAQGITVVVAAGDGGSGFCDTTASGASGSASHGLQVNGDASTPYNVAVGGTDFSDGFSGTQSAYWNSSNASGTQASAQSYVPEMTWNNTCASPQVVAYLGAQSAEALCNNPAVWQGTPPLLDVVGGTGGVSTIYSKPAWQGGVSGVPADGKRDLPDLSLFAGVGFWLEAYAFCQADAGGACDPSSPGGLAVEGSGGDSFGAPAFAGIMALVNQKAGSAQGLANPTLYSLGAGQYGSPSKPNTASSQACNTAFAIAPGNSCIFYDVTQGNNDVPCVPGTANCFLGNSSDVYGLLSTSSSSLVPAYAAGPGYDLATGLGSVNVANLINHWAVPSPPVLSINKTHAGNFAQGQAGATYAVTVSNGAAAGPTSGTVTVSENAPAALTITSMAGSGWSCAATACTRSDVLNAGSSYPAITVTVNVAASAPSQVTNQATVSGGGSTSATASDVTVIAAGSLTPTTTAAAANPTTFPASGSTTLTATVSASSGTPTGTVAFDLGSAQLGTATLAGSGGAAQAVVVVSGSQLAIGSNSITANYSGDATYAASSSSPVTVTVTQPAPSSGYTISTVAGNGQFGFGGDGGPAISATLSNVNDVALDSAGNLYFADFNNMRVRKVTPGGTISTVAGNGIGGFGGDGGPATSAELDEPTTVAVDGAGNLFIADWFNSRIRKVTPGGTISTVAGNGHFGFSGDGGPAAAAQLNAAQGVAADSAGNLYIADTDNNRVRKVTAAGTITTVAGNGTQGYSGDGGPATSAELDEPWSVAVDNAGNLYIADFDDSRVRKVTPGGTISTVATPAQLSWPSVAVDSAGNLFIADSGGRIWELPLNGTITAVAGNGTSGFSGDGGPALQAELNSPSGLVVDGAGNVFIADTSNYRVRKLTAAASSSSLTIAKTHSGSFSQGQTGATYTVTVGNAASSAPTSGTVTVTENPPTGLTVVSMTGSGWSCSGTACTRSDALNAGSVYAAITVTVNVASNAPSQVTNQATVSGGGSAAATTSDVTQITPMPGGIPTSTTLSANPATIPTTGSTTLTATANTLSGNGAPTGTVVFSLGATQLGSATLTAGGYLGVPGVWSAAAVLVVNGSQLALGSNTITAKYSGDTNYASSTSAAITVTVTQPQQTSGYTISTVAGGGLPPTPAPAKSAPVLPYSVATDSAGNVYLSSTFAVYKLDATGTLTRVAGAPGGANPLGDGGAATSAYLNNPAGIAVDPGGNLYIADADNNRIRKVTPAGTISTVAGNGVAGYSGDGGAATSARLNFPFAVAVDANGNLYIADDGNQRVRKVTAAGTISTVAGNGVTGYSGDGGAATSAELDGPSGVAVDPAGNLYIADTFNCAVRKVTPSGIISTVAGNGSWGFAGDGGAATGAELSAPEDVVLDASGNLYIADTSNFRIRKVTPSGTISTVAGTGMAGYSGDGGAAAGAELGWPSSIAVDANGNLYIADSRLRKVTAGGTISTIAGTGSADYGDGGAATSAGLDSPQAVAMDSSGNLYIADEYGDRVRKVTPSGSISTVAGNGGWGYSGDGGAATSAKLEGPTGLAVDASGNLYVADTSNNRVRKVTSDGTISTVAGTGTNGYIGDGGRAASAELSGPAGMAVDSAGNLFIADLGNNVIRKVTPAGTISTAAGNGSWGFAGDGGPATSAELASPQGVAVDSAGNLYIADAGNSVIRKVTPGGTISTVAGTGTAGYSGDGGPATSARLSAPQGVAVDSAGNLYIADGNDVVRRITTAGTISTVAGTGATGYSGDGGPGASATFGDPMGLAADSSGRVYIADAWDDAVRVLIPGASPQISSAGVVNAASYAGGPVSPGEIVAIFGSSLGPAGGAFLTLDSTGKVSTSLAGVTVTFNGYPAPLIYVGSGQINAIVPYEVAGSSSASLQVAYAGQASNPVVVPLTATTPALFTQNSGGSGPGAILNQNSQLNTQQNPAAKGSVVQIYVTGEGLTTPAQGTGTVTPVNTTGVGPLTPAPQQGVTVTIGGQPAPLAWAGEAPYFVAGVLQVNAYVPASVSSGAAPITVQVGANVSQSGVTVWVQ